MPDLTKFDYDVFISYSSHDKQWVRGDLLNRIEEAGLRVFIDFRDFTRGAAIIKEIERGVISCRKTLLILTPAYIESEWCEIENIILQTRSPANRDLRLIPLLKVPCEKPPRIAALIHIDFTDNADLDLAWCQLITALETPSKLLDENVLHTNGGNTERPSSSIRPPGETPPISDQRWINDIIEQDYRNLSMIAPTGTGGDGAGSHADDVRFCRDVFSDHYVEHAVPPKESTDEFPPSPEKLAWMFHREYFFHDDENIRRGMDEKDRQCPWNEFVKECLHMRAPYGGRPINKIAPCNCNILIGRVGVGKTSLLSQLMVKLPEDLDRNSYWFIRFDFERFIDKDDCVHFLAQPIEDITLSFINRFGKLLEDSIDWNFGRDVQRVKEILEGFRRDASENGVIQKERAAYWIREIAGNIERKFDKRIVLFLDNSDLLDYLFDRASFFPEGFARRKDACRKLAAIFKLF